MTVEERIKLLLRFGPTTPVGLADAAGQFHVTRYDIEALMARARQVARPSALSLVTRRASVRSEPT